MTIAKRFALSAVLIAALLLLVSCKGGANGDAESDDALSMLLEIVESAQTTAEAEYYVVVIPSEATSELARKANSLVLAIEEITGVDSVLEYENGDNPRRDGAMYIILGNTERNESRIALAELRDGDYVCKIIDEAIVIGGISDEDTIIAVDRFMSEVLPYASAEQIMSEEAGFEHFAESNAEVPVLLCGFLICDFGIVGGSDAISRNAADSIRGAILSEEGSALDMLDSRRNGAKDIVLELVSSDTYVGEGYISYDGEDVILRAFDAYGMKVVSDRFCDLLLADEQTDEICLGENWDMRVVKCPNRPFDVELVVLDDGGEGIGLVDRVTAICENISGSKPSLVLIDKLSLGAWELLRAVIPEGYTCTHIDDGEIFAIIYDSSVAELSVDRSDNGCLEMLEISVKRANGEPSYDVTYLYADSADPSDDVLKAVRGIADEKRADMIFSVCALPVGESVELDGSVMSELDRVCDLDDSRVCIDAFGTGDNVLLEDVFCKGLTKNGSPFGSACRVFGISLLQGAELLQK